MRAVAAPNRPFLAANWLRRRHGALSRSLVNGNGRSYVGSLVTTRIGSNGTYNVVGALDSFTHLYKDDYLTLNVAHSWWSDAMATAGGHAAADSRRQG